MLQINSICLDNFDYDKHYSLISSMSNDKKVQGYISRDLKKFVKSPIGENFEVGKTYVAVIDGREVGLVGTLEMDRSGNVEIWYAILNRYRDRGYASKVLGLFTPYVVENVDGLNDIKLRICYDNIASNKVALNNGFVLMNKDDLNKLNNYLYFGR